NILYLSEGWRDPLRKRIRSFRVSRCGAGNTRIAFKTTAYRCNCGGPVHTWSRVFFGYVYWMATRRTVWRDSRDSWNFPPIVSFCRIPESIDTKAAPVKGHGSVSGFREHCFGSHYPGGGRGDG